MKLFNYRPTASKRPLGSPPPGRQPNPTGDGSWQILPRGNAYYLIGNFAGLEIKRVVTESNAMAFELGRLAIPYEIIFPLDGTIQYKISLSDGLKAALGLPGIKQ